MCGFQTALIHSGAVWMLHFKAHMQYKCLICMCVPLCACVEDRSACGLSSIPDHLECSDRLSHTEPGLTVSARLARHKVPESSAPAYPAPGLHALGIQTQVFMFKQQAFYPLGHLPSSYVTDF